MVELHLKKLKSKKYILTVFKDAKIMHRYIDTLDNISFVSMIAYDIDHSVRLTGDW